ncbi:MAG: 4-(cytidine 5'-diphospho)-2-C-methyl-D-erythritol kinase [Paracoccaceae bacterium]|nr:4-(cytidine 5'-diphospho)-2-C-methyl-D-erythritol kinase [Paracoccaceae bacterium]
MKKKESFSRISRAKVNLSLHVVGKRSDGYHCLDSLVAFPRVGDEISMEPSRNIDFRVIGRFADELKSKKNLVLSAIDLLNHDGKGASIILNKDLPISAGLGGGSSNAALVLRMLTKLWQQPLPSINSLISLGSDVPACLDWDLKRMQGRGEILEKVVAPPTIWIVLANNGEKVSTRIIFNAVQTFNNEGLGILPIFNTAEIFLDYLHGQKNDLESPALKLFPQIMTLLNAIRSTSGCKISRMSGSGATCFGLFLTESDAQKASQDLAKSFPKAWIRVAQLFS